ncbi:TPA: ead/Ea22-like family protein [Klebsiella variicola]
MTDITELAQSLKAAAEKATQGRWEYYPGNTSIEYNVDSMDEDQGSIVYVDSGDFTQAQTDRNGEFIALANPANILALVEALEKAKGMDAYWKTQCRGITDHCEELQARIAQLESRTVQLSPELYTIGELIRTQDNRITDQPMFVVFQKREIIGSDEHSPSRICWVWDGEEVSELRAKRLEALYQDGRDTRGYDRYAMQEVDEFVTACFTEHGCKDYLRQNGHNLRLPYIYACGSFRNNEYQLVRNWLAGIKVEAE